MPGCGMSFARKGLYPKSLTTGLMMCVKTWSARTRVSLPSSPIGAITKQELPSSSTKYLPRRYYYFCFLLLFLRPRNHPCKDSLTPALPVNNMLYPVNEDSRQLCEPSFTVSENACSRKSGALCPAALSIMVYIHVPQTMVCCLCYVAKRPPREGVGPLPAHLLDRGQLPLQLT